MAENFNLIFGQNASQSYAWSDSDYQNGWQTVGDTPPTAQQFDALQRRADLKAQELNNALTPLVTANNKNNRKPSTTYAEKDIQYSDDLPTGWFLECTVAGTTSAGALVIPSPVHVNDTITDGTVTWTVKKTGSGNGDGVPLGAILPLAHNSTLPAGYLLCDGSAVSRTMYPDLFAAIGTTYGAGDGSTTFNLPNYSDGKFPEGSTVAGVVKQPGLPNITGMAEGFKRDARISPSTGALTNTVNYTSHNFQAVTTSNETGRIIFDASLSNPIYGNSTTVQPNALTARYIIKAFDGQTADSALIDITQYANELNKRAYINGSNMVHHKDVITTSGTYTAPVTGLYKITVKGGGGGGGGGRSTSNSVQAGAGGGEGGTTIGYAQIALGESVSVAVGAGGAGGAVNSTGSNGGNSTVTIGSTIFTGGGGAGASNDEAGLGGLGTINGCSGSKVAAFDTASGAMTGGTGGGAGGAAGIDSLASADGTQGGGGAGGRANGSSPGTGGAGGDGYVWFEYYTPGA